MNWNEIHKFEVKPLDVNIARMQMNLMKKSNEIIVDDNTDFDGIKEVCDCTQSPVYKINVFETMIERETDGDIALKGVITSKTSKTYSYTFAKGTKKEVLDFLESKLFFGACKELAYFAEKKEGK